MSGESKVREKEKRRKVTGTFLHATEQPRFPLFELDVMGCADRGEQKLKLLGDEEENYDKWCGNHDCTPT